MVKETYLRHCPGIQASTWDLSLAELSPCHAVCDEVAKRVKFPTAQVFVHLFRAAHVSNGLPETCLINSCQALTCSWASASSYLQNIPEERELSPLFPQNSEGPCMNSIFFLCGSLGLLLFW